MRLFRRSCDACGTRPQRRVAERITGHAGETTVTLFAVPYRACRCGRLARWAFDPSLDLSEQLFEGGIAFADGGGIRPARCSACGTELGDRVPVTLEATARVDGDAEVLFRAELRGYRCPRCGVAQAPRGAFDAGRYGPASEGAAALVEATRSLRLPV